MSRGMRFPFCCFSTFNRKICTSFAAGLHELRLCSAANGVKQLKVLLASAIKAQQTRKVPKMTMRLKQRNLAKSRTGVVLRSQLQRLADLIRGQIFVHHGATSKLCAIQISPKHVAVVLSKNGPPEHVHMFSLTSGRGFEVQPGADAQSESWYLYRTADLLTVVESLLREQAALTQFDVSRDMTGNVSIHGKTLGLFADQSPSRVLSAHPQATAPSVAT